MTQIAGSKRKAWISVRILICLLVIGGLLMPVVSAAQSPAGRRGAAKRPPDPPKTDKDLGPFTLMGLLDGLKNIEPLEPGRLAELVKKRGVSFVRGPEVIKMLKDAGASDALIEAIPEPPPPPPAKTAGELTVECAPRDCEVVVNSQYQGQTANGRKRIAGLPPGPANIVAFSDGYAQATKRVTLEIDKPSHEAFMLHPSQNTRLHLGALFILDTVTELGGMMAIADLPSVAPGKVELPGSSGPVQYNIRFSHAASGGTLEITGPNMNCSTALTREGVRPPQCKGKTKPGVADAAEQVARMFWDHNLAVLLDRALAGKITAEAWRDARSLKSETATEKLVLQIRADRLPVEIEVQPQQGEPEKVTFWDFTTAGKLKYPKKTVVIRGGNTVGTIQLQ
jgi:hypothetical protein